MTKTNNKTDNKNIMPGAEMIQNQNQDPSPDVVDKIEAEVLQLVTEYQNTLDDPEDLKENNGLFVGMLKYIYRYYLSVLLNNNKGVNNRYDYQLLDKLFNIYTSLVYQYKKNKQPYINEFCIFLNINRETLYSVRYGNTKKVTPNDIQNVKRWFNECEQGLLNTDSVGAIFRLKSMFNYNDNLAPIPVEMQGQTLSAAQLPDLSANNDKKMLLDKKSDG